MFSREFVLIFEEFVFLLFGFINDVGVEELETGVILNVLLSSTGFLWWILLNDFISPAHEVSVRDFGVFFEHSQCVFVVVSEMFFDHWSHVFDGVGKHFFFFLSLFFNVFAVVLRLRFGATGEKNFSHYEVTKWWSDNDYSWKFDYNKRFVYWIEFEWVRKEKKRIKLAKWKSRKSKASLDRPWR